MKYLYYIAGILVVFSILAAYGLMGTRVKISKPSIVVNDRIITEFEFKEMLVSKPYYMTKDQYIDSIITRQLLIQEAVSQEINKEESFRKSIESFYEQSLIKILLDRKSDSLAVDVTDREMEKYQKFSQSRVYVSKLVYKTLDEALAGKNFTLQKIESDFIDISDYLKAIILSLEKGESSQPLKSNSGMPDSSVVVYRLDDVKQLDTGKIKEIDMERVSLFIRDKKKEALMDEWTKTLKKKAEIWRKK
ncbi:MAG: hypothetical protein B6230_01505 [Desulfobacteraceae bacterium 4572_89]|nr:MAG: hypothetical protein B6230_01505 [Desulfobacteraceae bacterium 4572_89]